MKHKPVIISIPDLVNRIDRDSDDFDLFDALERGPEKPGESADGDEQAWTAYAQALQQFIKEHVGEFVIVTWPEHVISPAYNGDANYSGPMSLAEARTGEPEAVITWQPGD